MINQPGIYFFVQQSKKLEIAYFVNVSLYAIQCLWTLCGLKLGLSPTPIGNIEAEATLLNQTFKTKTKGTDLARLVFHCLIWSVWREKCKVL